MKFLIKNDLFDIFERIKNYDNNYFIVFDTDLSKFKVYTDKFQIDKTPEYIEGNKLYYVLTFPYKELDVRSIQYLYQTEIKNVDLLIKNLNLQNDILEKTNDAKNLNQSMTEIEKYLREQSKGG